MTEEELVKVNIRSIELAMDYSKMIGTSCFFERHIIATASEFRNYILDIEEKENEV